MVVKLHVMAHFSVTKIVVTVCLYTFNKLFKDCCINNKKI